LNKIKTITINNRTTLTNMKGSLPPYSLTELLLGPFRREFRQISYSGWRLWIVERLVAAFHSVGVERLAPPPPFWAHVDEDCVIVPPSSGQSPGRESCSGSAADAVKLGMNVSRKQNRAEPFSRSNPRVHWSTNQDLI